MPSKYSPDKKAEREARRVFGETSYVMVLRATEPLSRVVAGGIKPEIQVFDETLPKAFKTLILCLKALPDFKQPRKKKT